MHLLRKLLSEQGNFEQIPISESPGKILPHQTARPTKLQHDKQRIKDHIRSNWKQISGNWVRWRI